MKAKILLTFPTQLQHLKSMFDRMEIHGTQSMKDMHFLHYKSALVHSKEPADVQKGIELLECQFDYV